jgi:hypothetical protein
VVKNKKNDDLDSKDLIKGLIKWRVFSPGWNFGHVIACCVLIGFYP